MAKKRANKNMRNEIAHGTERGKQFVDSLLEQYGDMPIRQLGTIISENEQAKTVLIRWMMKNSGISLERLAKYLGCMPQSLRNKMVRDSFSFDDLVICAHACNCSIQIKNNSQEGDDGILVIDPMDFFNSSDPENTILERLHELDQEDLAAKEEEYLKLKEELERMQAEYGFK